MIELTGTLVNAVNLYWLTFIAAAIIFLLSTYFIWLNIRRDENANI